MMKHFLNVKRSLAVAAASLMLLAAQNASAYTYTALRGVGGTGDQGYPSLVDGLIKTKACKQFTSGSTNYYVVFKANEALVPTNYFLVQGGDTGKLPERNWKSWQVFGGNFADDADARKDAEGWVLLDERVNYEFTAVNYGPVDFVCTENPTEAYQYFMVKVTESVGAETYMQMAEFGWGTSADFFAEGPVEYLLLSGDKTWSEWGEYAELLFDGNYGTKFGNDLVPGQPQYEIFMTARPIAPTWCCLVTAADASRFPDRDWKSWQIYGGNFASDADAKRDAEGWVLIDERVGEELTVGNNAECYFDFNQNVTDKFRFFKIEINACRADFQVYMQMAEFFFGNADMKQSEIDRHYNAVQMEVTEPCQKSVLENYQTLLASIKTASSLSEMMKLYNQTVAAQNAVKSSVSVYAEYAQMVNQLRVKFDNGKIDASGQTIVGNYLNTNAAPDKTYSNGTYQYIMENLLLDVDALRAEEIFVNQLLEQYATDLTEGAIDVTYTVIGGNNGWNAAEGCFALFDGDDNTKWALDASSRRIVFKTSEPIAPTYYRLFTGNDTGNFPERNWVSWKVYAANFETDDDWEVMAGWDGWTVIDDKQNAGPELIPAANAAACFIYLSNPSETPYQYFMIDISAPTGFIQMSEFTFGNTANSVLTRREYVEKFSNNDYDDAECYAAYVEQYNTALNNLKNSATLNDVARYYTELNNLSAAIEASINYYKEYANAVAELDGCLSMMSSTLNEVWSSYIYDEVEPGNLFVNGSYLYIFENFNLDNETIQKEIANINETVLAVLSGGLTAISGTYGWDGQDYTKLIDRDMSTKWAGKIPDGGAYIIFSWLEATQPLFYWLTTGGDTGKLPERNWKDWQIYGGNFASKDEATRDADGWVLIDDRKDVSQKRLPPLSDVTVPFGFTEGMEEGYKYFKIEVIAPCGMPNIQMTEFQFGTEEEFESLRQMYLDSIATYNIDEVKASEELFARYDEYETAIYETSNMEELCESFIGILDVIEEMLRDPEALTPISGTAPFSEFSGYTKLIDKDLTSKWCDKVTTDSHIIFKRAEAVQPLFYKLTTGDRTGQYPERNWQDWQIFGGNFASDAEATRNAEGWVLIDSHVNDTRLPGANTTTVPFDFSEGANEAYQYFMIVITAAHTDLNYHMSQVDEIEMGEFEFGTAEELEAARQEYTDSLATFDFSGVVADVALNERYEAYKATIESTNSMEELYDTFAAIVALIDEVDTNIADVTVGREQKHTIYTLQGVRVDEPTEKGIYIVDGKKIVIR